MTNRKQHGGHGSPDRDECEGAGEGQRSYRIGEVVEIRGLDKDDNSAGNPIALRRTTSGLVVDRPRPDAEGSLSGEEIQTMEMSVPMDPLANILDRLVSVAEKWLERQVAEEGAEKPTADPKYLTPEEVATILRLNVQTVLKWCRDGKINAAKLGGNEGNGKGGKYLIPRESVDAYIAQQTLIHGERRRSAK